MDNLATMLQLLRVQAVHIAAATRALNEGKAALGAMIETVEASLPRMGSLDRARTKQVLGEVRHAIGMEIRAALPPLISVAKAAPFADIGANAAPSIWVLFILDGPILHTVPLSTEQLAHLHMLRRDDYAVGELAIWVKDTEAVATAIGAAGLCDEVAATALLQALRETE